jgi:hypothetical protein
MSTVQAVAAGTGLAMAVSLALTAVLPAPHPITIHAITYSDGLVTQDRTVTGSAQTVFMGWAAKIVEASTGVVICSGADSFYYPTGRKVAQMPLDVWTGDPNCRPENLAPGVYYPEAVYSWADNSVTARGDPFRIGG